MGSCPKSHMKLWSHSLASIRDKLKSLHIHYHGAYGHKTWEDDDLLWGTSIHDFTWCFDHAAFGDLVTNWNYCIPTTRVLMVTSRSRNVTYLDGLLPINSHDPLITWFCEVTWQNISTCTKQGGHWSRGLVVLQDHSTN